jgi:hypothetical protein
MEVAFLGIDKLAFLRIGSTIDGEAMITDQRAKIRT